MCQANSTAGCEDGVAPEGALHLSDGGGALRKRIRDLEAALSGCLTGGNHLASALGRRLVGHEWPRPDVDPHDALETLGAGDTFDMWCAWRAAMLASSVLASPIEEATSVADTVPAANKSASLTPQNFEGIARKIICPTDDCSNIEGHTDFCHQMTMAITSALSKAYEDGERRWRNDCGILLAQLDFLTEATGEGLDCQDAGLVHQIRADYQCEIARKDNG